MPTPPFVVELRRKIGHDLLLLPGLAGVILDDQDRVLLHRRSDNGKWSLICGVLEPGEQPDVALEREVEEETSLRVKAVQLLDAAMQPPVTYTNGDRAQFLMVAYRCEVLEGEARVNDDESTDVRWFARDALPTLQEDYLRYIDRAFAMRRGEGMSVKSPSR